MDFERRYKNLNSAQKEAVDTIDGPVMVIAGPGTGKTELLSIRTANILRQTDTLPENILCLTFTDSGANAMRERLTGIIGKDAYKVAIHTFHSFGSEIINQYGEFFYEGAHFRPADELSRYEVIKNIFEGLGHNNVLNKKMNGDFTYLSNSLTVISELKKSGLTSDELLQILDANDSAIEKAEQVLGPIFADKITKLTADKLAAQIEVIRKSKVNVTLPTVVSLAEVIADSLQEAVDEAASQNSTKPVTAWRNLWFKKNEDGKFVLKSQENQKKLRAISSIYEQYLARMSEAELFDFDDMILRVVHAIEIFDELRFNLQERYQYIMVDEFQDTNMAQMRILHNLMDSQISGDMPNILVVGDDDQAIYSFQGADISNVTNFRSTYPKVKIIGLKENYRSGDHILTQARSLITQGKDRLEDQIPELNKSLLAMSKSGAGVVELHEAANSADERHWLIEDIKSKLKQSTNLCEIAVLTRTHREIEALLPYFANADIPIQYERRDNVLDMAPIVLVEQLSRVLIGILLGKHAEVNAMLPELLSHPAWHIKPSSLWQLSLKAYQNRTFWLDEMSSNTDFIHLRDWLISTALSIPHQPLEIIMDKLIGKLDSMVSDDEQDDSDPEAAKNAKNFHSPIYEYYFSDNNLEKHSDNYTRYLHALKSIRTNLRDYRPLETPNLLTFIEYIDLHRSIGSGITSITGISTKANAIQLMTAHKSKGLEFNDVYIINAVDNVWGERARGHNRLISYPENLPLAPAGDSADERLRLFYVAATRAKNNLHISYSLIDDRNKSTARASFLLGDSWIPSIIDGAHNITNALETAELSWYEPVIKSDGKDLKDILAPQLENYQLSATHLNNFLDITRGGPKNFLVQNLLRFPQAMSPAAAYGSAIHKTLQRAHAHIAANNGTRQAIEDILHNFEIALSEQRLAQTEFENYLQKGIDDLQVFLTDKYNSFTATQKTELNFKSQHVIIGEAHLSGALDLIDINDNIITVTDYKTGRPARSWAGKTDYEKIKLHKYKQQLMFYKLLIENARDYRGFKVESGILQFIEPSSSGAILALETDFNVTDQDRFSELIAAVWRHIINLDMPDTSDYEQSIKGIQAFEQDLIDNKI